MGSGPSQPARRRGLTRCAPRLRRGPDRRGDRGLRARAGDRGADLHRGERGRGRRSRGDQHGQGSRRLPGRTPPLCARPGRPDGGHLRSRSGDRDALLREQGRGRRRRGHRDCGSPDSLAISADGRSVYATGNDGSGSATPSLSVFSRDPLTGALTFLRTQFRNSPGSRGSTTQAGLATAPDGAQVYVAGERAGRRASRAPLAAFGELDPANRIGFAACLHRRRATAATSSPACARPTLTCDGLGLYAAAATSSLAVSAFSREGGPGHLRARARAEREVQAEAQAPQAGVEADRDAAVSRVASSTQPGRSRRPAS